MGKLPVVLMCLTALVMGCSRQDFTRTTFHVPFADALDSGRPYVPARRPLAAVRAERLAKALAARRARAGPAGDDYRIGPHDVLRIGVFALEEPGRITTLERTVSDSGQITLPWIDGVKAAGCTIGQLEERLRAAYAGKYLADPQVTAAVAEYRSVAVTVGGQVETPDVYYLKRNASTVLEMLALAGGPTEEAGDVLLLIRAGSQEADAEAPATEAGPRSVAIDLAQLMDEANPQVNLTVRAGDIITLPKRRKTFVYILGYVQRPGAYELKDGMRIDVLRVVAMGGGLTSMARASKAKLIRETPTGHQVISLDLIKIAKGIRPPVYLESGDTLVVGSSFGARVGEYLRPRASFGATTGL